MLEREAFLKEIEANPDDPVPRLIFADWLDDHDQPDLAEHYRNGCPVPKSLDGCDWPNVFAYAGEKNEYGDGVPTLAPAKPGSTVSLAPFARKDIRRVTASVEGENDNDHWLCVGELWDGRFFAIKAWCDYTGWG